MVVKIYTQCYTIGKPYIYGDKAQKYKSSLSNQTKSSALGGYRVFIKYCVFFQEFRKFATSFRRSRVLAREMWQTFENSLEKNTIFNEHPVIFWLYRQKADERVL